MELMRDGGVIATTRTLNKLLTRVMICLHDAAVPDYTFRLVEVRIEDELRGKRQRLGRTDPAGWAPDVCRIENYQICREGWAYQIRSSLVCSDQPSIFATLLHAVSRELPLRLLTSRAWSLPTLPGPTVFKTWRATATFFSANTHPVVKFPRLPASSHG